jgi:hypothetical protein
MLLLGLLALVVYQDFRYRSLSIIVLASLFAVVFSNSILLNGWKLAGIYFGENLLQIGIQLVGITIYFSWKQRRLINIINTYLGSGDVWFYAIVAWCFSPLNFVLFNLVTCGIVLAGYAIYRYAKPNERTIPLAGCLALGLMLLLMMSQFFNVVKPYDDTYLMSRLLTVGLMT